MNGTRTNIPEVKSTHHSVAEKFPEQSFDSMRLVKEKNPFEKKNAKIPQNVLSELNEEQPKKKRRKKKGRKKGKKKNLAELGIQISPINHDFENVLQSQDWFTKLETLGISKQVFFSHSIFTEEIKQFDGEEDYEKIYAIFTGKKNSY